MSKRLEAEWAGIMGDITAGIYTGNDQFKTGEGVKKNNYKEN